MPQARAAIKGHMLLDRDLQDIDSNKKSDQEDELEGRNVILVTNLKAARLRGVESQGMLLAADAGDGEHDKALVLLELWDQAGVEQRALAGAGLGVKEQQPFREHAREEVAGLALAAEKEVALLIAKGARAQHLHPVIRQVSPSADRVFGYRHPPGDEWATIAARMCGDRELLDIDVITGLIKANFPARISFAARPRASRAVTAPLVQISRISRS